MFGNSHRTSFCPEFTHRSLFWRVFMTRNDTVLVLGASGGIGGEVARQLRDAGWQVRALKRGAAEAETRKDGITWLAGDAMDRQAVMRAAKGCAVIVHAVNPPGYRGWAQLVLPMVDNTIAAARAEGATIVLPGTVYNFGPDAFPLLAEDSPQHPVTRKGAIRVEMEKRLEDASRDGGARVLIVRAGDFFGPRPGNNWFSQGLVKAGQPVKAVSYPGRPGMGHQWSYLPDVARTMVELLARHHLARNARDALPVADAGGNGQREAGGLSRARAAHAARRSGGGRARRHGQPRRRAGGRARLKAQNTDRPVRATNSSSAFMPSSELPVASSAGDQTHSVSLSGTTATMPPPTPLLQGRPMEKATSPAAS
jgi:nucleoside-diphosphate-sugar epimerase